MFTLQGIQHNKDAQAWEQPVLAALGQQVSPRCSTPCSLPCVGSSDQPCWLAEACKILLPHPDVLSDEGNSHPTLMCFVLQTIKDNLWSVYEPEPASEEEMALEAKQKEAVQLEKAREKVLP